MGGSWAGTLRRAASEGWALAGFSAYNLEQMKGICAAAEVERAPVILQAGSSAFGYAGREPLAGLAVSIASETRADVAVHLDHSRDIEEIEACLKLGYDSVMFDGSSLELEENIRRTRDVVKLASPFEAWVEGELGGVAGDEDRTTEVAGRDLTDPGAAATFVERTGVDALAVAIGNVHGIPEAPITLDFERLAAIRSRVDVPLVLHGASGLPDDDLVEAIGLGVAKINVNTELRRAFHHGIHESVARPPGGDDLASLLDPATRAVEEAAAGKIRTFGAAGRTRAASVVPAEET